MDLAAMLAAAHFELIEQGGKSSVPWLYARPPGKPGKVQDGIAEAADPGIGSQTLEAEYPVMMMVLGVLPFDDDARAVRPLPRPVFCGGNLFVSGRVSSRVSYIGCPAGSSSGRDAFSHCSGDVLIAVH